MGRNAPRSVRLAIAGLCAMVPLGVALIVIGVVELRWWNSAGTARLFELFAMVKADNGLERPSVLREPGGAWGLVGLGIISLAYAGFAPYIRRGSRKSRTFALVSGILLLLYVVIDLGADATFGVSIDDYIGLLGAHKAVPGATPADFAPYWPAPWFSWFEDIAQGLQALAFLGILIALAAASIDQEQPLVVRDEPADAFGKALRRFVDDRRDPAE